MHAYRDWVHDLARVFGYRAELKFEASRKESKIGRLIHMGIRLCRAPVLPRLTGLCLVLVGLLASTSHVGCKSGGRSKISSKLFLAPFTEPSTATTTRGISQRAAKNDFLRAIRPTALESEFDTIQPVGFPLGRLSSNEIDVSTGRPKVTENLLVYDSQSRSILSASLLSSSKSNIRLHFSSRGLGEEVGEGEGTAISTTVTPIKLKNGWILTFDAGSKNIVAFREQTPRTVTDDLGTRTVPYRSPNLQNGRVNSDSKNFGHGNGLVLSVVITGEDALEQLHINAGHSVARFVEIEENKVLVFYNFQTIRSVQLLELAEEDVDVDFDLDDPIRPSERLRIQHLRGKYKLFPTPLLTYRQIAETVTQEENLELDSTQPVVFTHPDLPAPFALVFDRTTSNFIKIRLLRGADNAVTGATVALAASSAAFQSVLQGSASSTTVDPPFNLRNGFQRSQGRREVFYFESKSANIVAFDPDPRRTPENAIRVFVTSAGFLFRRDPRGNNETGAGDPEKVDFATADIRLNRLAFDHDFRQLIGVSYDSGVVVVVANAAEISVVTNDPIADLTYIEPLDNNNVRAFDLRTTSILDFRIEYVAFPVSVQ